MVKDPKRTILPGYGIHFTRSEAISRVELNSDYKWKDWYRFGWRIVKVNITEITIPALVTGKL